MKIISKEQIEQVYGQMNAVSPEEAAKTVEFVKARQPQAFEYLVSAGAQQDFTREEAQWLSYIGVILCRILVEAEPASPAITRECIDQCAARITDLVRYLKGSDKDDFVKVIAAMLKDYPQPHLLNFVVSVIRTGQEEKAGITPKNASVFFFFFKILMDAFIQTREGQEHQSAQE